MKKQLCVAVTRFAVMTSLSSVTLDVPDIAAAEKFYLEAFGSSVPVKFSQSDSAQSGSAPSGFRGYTISLLVAQPGDAGLLFDAAVAAGATVVKPIAKSLWGVGGVIQAPDGAIIKLATSAKKDTTKVSKNLESVVILIAASDVSVTKKFYEDKGFTVGKSFGKYVEFDLKPSPIGFGLYSIKALAKDAGVAPEQSDSHHIVLNGDAGSFTDPDGFVWAS